MWVAGIPQSGLWHHTSVTLSVVFLTHCISTVLRIAYYVDSWWPRASLVTQQVKNLPAMLETWVRSLGWEDPLEKGKATHSSVLAWRIPCIVWSKGWQRVGPDWVNFTFTFMMAKEISVFISTLRKSKSVSRFSYKVFITVPIKLFLS